MKKRNNGSLTNEQGVWTCKASGRWPPLRLYPGGESIESLRPKLTQLEYSALKTWETTCGLFVMEAPKCFGCPNVLLNGKPQKTSAPPPPMYRRKKNVRDA